MIQHYGFLVLTIIIAVVSAQFVCNKKYKKLGCYKEDTNGFILHDYRNLLVWDVNKLPAALDNIVCTCEQYAKQEGYRYFAVRFWAQCVGLNQFNNSSNLSTDMCKNGLFNNCDDNDDYSCVGKVTADYVYQIRRDGGYSSWSNFSSCSHSCGLNGIQQRTRQCNHPTTIPNGNDCSVLGPAVESRACNVGVPCVKVDGSWGQWSSYDTCSVSCGAGYQTRTRKCDSPAPVGSGNGCVGRSKEGLSCNTHACPDMCRANPEDRKQCGRAGITESECTLASGCCFNSKTTGTHWCYDAAKIKPGPCSVNPEDRKACGPAGVTKSQCESKGCCFNSKFVNSVWCYYKNH